MTNESRFSQREQQIKSTTITLEVQVNQYTRWAWWSVKSGVVVLIIAIILFFIPSYQEFAKFLGGIIAAIWTLSGLFFVYVAFLGQKQSIQNQQLELFYNREELKATREELEGQKLQMIKQNETLKQQQFENTFFHLLEQLKTEIENLSILDKNKVNLSYSGLDAIKYLYSLLKDEYDLLDIKDEEIKLSKTLYTFIQKNGLTSSYRFYIIGIYIILEFLDKHCIYNHDIYIDTIRGHLNNSAVLLLAYHIFNPNGSKKLKNLIEKYRFVRYIYPESLIDEKHKKYFKNSIFEKTFTQY